MGVLHSLYVLRLYSGSGTHRVPHLFFCCLSRTGDFFIPGFQCPHRTARIGTMGDGGKWVCGLEHIQKKKKCVIYSFGKLRFSTVLGGGLGFMRTWGFIVF